jgi:O-antigen/teichoic acid export membrane protein
MRRLFSASFANLLVPLSGLLLSPFLSRELGPDGRGLYAALTLPIVICGWLGTLGLQDALTVHIRRGELSPRQAAKVIRVASVPLGVLGIAVMAMLGAFTFAGHHAQYRDFLILALFAPLQITANLVIGAGTGASDLRGVNLIKAVPALVRTAVVIFACVAFDLSVFAAGLLFMITSSSAVLIGFRRLRDRSGGGRHRAADALSMPPQGEEGTIPTRSLVTYSLACMPGVLAAVSSARLDQVVGLPLIGAQQLGFYAVAVSVAEIPMVMATGARTILLGRDTGVRPQDATAVARLAVVAAVLSCAFLAAIARFAVPFVFGRSFGPAVAPTVILCIATILYTSMSLFTAALLAQGRAGWSSAALVTGSAAGIAFLFILSPYGAVGASVASLIGYATSVVVAMWGLRTTGSPYTVRMLTIPFAHDLVALREAWAKLARRPPMPATSENQTSG